MSKKLANPIALFGTPASITWSLWLLTIPLSFTMTFSFMPSGFEGHLLLLCLVAVVAHIATGLVLYLGRVFLLSTHNRINVKFLIIVVFILSGIARGLTVGQLSVFFNIEIDAYFAYRILSSIVTLLFTFVLLSTLISNGMSNRLESDQLRVDIKNLNQLKAESKNQILRIRDKVQEEIRRILTSNLSQITSTEQVAIISEKMIRPLGHQLFLNIFKSTEFPRNLSIKKRLKPQEIVALIGTLIVAQPFNILIVAMAEIFIPLVLKIYTLGIGLDLALSITPIVIPISILSVAKYAQNKRLKDRKVGFPLPRILAIWLLAALSSGLVGNSITIFHTYIPKPGLYAFFQLLLFLTISALFYGLLVEQLKIRKSLAITAESLRLQELLLKRQMAFEEKRLGKIIHGDLQARLILLALQPPKAASHPGGSNPEFVIQVENILGKTFQKIQESSGSIKFSESIENLTHLWEPVLEIKTHFQADVSDLMQLEPLISLAVLDIIGEALTNAFRHGRATSVAIEISSDTSKSLMIKVIDNGTFSRGSSVGIGSKLLSELSSSWQIATIKGKTELSVRIELVP